MKSLRSRGLSAFIVLASAMRVFADSPASPYPWVIASADRSVVFNLFDITTGEIESTRVDEGAKSRRQFDQEKRDEAQREGERLLKTWPQRTSFEKDFVISEAEASGSKVAVSAGNLFPGPEWSAEFVPRRPSEIRQSVSAVFPRTENEILKVSVVPADIMAALDLAVLHPALAAFSGNGKMRSVTLRITGDRLNWDIVRLESWLRPWRAPDSDLPDWKDWAELHILFHGKPMSEAFFLHGKTGELLYEAGAPSKRVPVLFGRKGEKISPP